MSSLFDPVTVRKSLNSDPEFHMHARYLTCSFRIVVEDIQSLLVTTLSGEIVEVSTNVTHLDGWDFQLAGTAEHWEKLLNSVPAPFYQDFFAAMIYHGFRIEGNMEMILAYYPAVRRLLEILRNQASNSEAAA